jgi:cytochrome c nitrite reductase small subunit|uniref:Cytochrome c nitrite reductase small subunit n=1 Tax=Desulfobacca acetoxidans TaxID=60893 RepID=A0A7C3Z0C5_9BACT
MLNFLQRGRFWLSLVILVLVAAALGAFLAFGPPRLYATSESPEFCGSCHVMETEYEAWFHAGAHRRLKCVDCHLPNDHLADHLLWKGIDGGRDFVTFHLGLYAENIRLTARGAQIVKENCLRCHAEIMARVSEDRNCWVCHRQTSHRKTGVVAALAPQP